MSAKQPTPAPSERPRATRLTLPLPPPLPHESLADYRKRCGWTEAETIFGTAEQVEALVAKLK
jgi:hypothetical protein